MNLLTVDKGMLHSVLRNDGDKATGRTEVVESLVTQQILGFFRGGGSIERCILRARHDETVQETQFLGTKKDR